MDVSIAASAELKGTVNQDLQQANDPKVLDPDSGHTLALKETEYIHMLMGL
ncbi:MAG: hypothetical protein JRH18_24575 [Deltaproteobacteria bacterium]|nr:hypothetical protein [Deltaproteobacteria bacterium]MBW1962516.1 hypothetical protein [Deltaproteobacteria bacterium]MBW2154824.1 hypothetical protein [Deltaproteobacteria bacterium]